MRELFAKLGSLFDSPAGRRAFSYRALFESTSNGIVLVDASSLQVLDANTALLGRAGYTRNDIARLKLQQLFTSDNQNTSSLLLQLRQAGERATFNWFELRAGGEAMPVEVHCSRTQVDGVNLLALISHDVSLRKKVESQLIENQQRLDHLAHHDQLTGLPNRHYLTAFLPEALAAAKAKGEMLAILFIDLDHFKHVNDSRGHEVGDRLLQEVAQRIKAKTREQDTVIRMGGDEFVVVLREITDSDQVSQTARRINGTLDQPITIDGHKLVTTASIGVSVYPHDGDDISELLKHSDSAMYQAKEGGRNKFQMFRVDMMEKIKARVAVEGALRAAIKAQPVRCGLSTDHRSEIATRCRARGAGPLAASGERSLSGLTSSSKWPKRPGLIVPIGNFVIRHVLEDMIALARPSCHWCLCRSTCHPASSARATSPTMFASSCRPAALVRSRWSSN